MTSRDRTIEGKQPRYFCVKDVLFNPWPVSKLLPDNNMVRHSVARSIILVQSHVYDILYAIHKSCS